MKGLNLTSYCTELGSKKVCVTKFRSLFTKTMSKLTTKRRNILITRNSEPVSFHPQNGSVETHSAFIFQSAQLSGSSTNMTETWISATIQTETALLFTEK